MNNSNADFPLDRGTIEHQIDDVLQEPVDLSRVATGKVQVQRRTLHNYEALMRSHADRCLAGR